MNTEIVPYDKTLPGAGKVNRLWRQVVLDTGATVAVGLEKSHSQSPTGIAATIRMEKDQPEGTRSRLEFAMTHEACIALVALYIAHGLVTEEHLAIILHKHLKIIEETESNEQVRRAGKEAMSSEKPIVGAGESSPAPDGSEWEGVVVECEAIDEEDDSENIAVLNDLPRHWIGKRVRVTLIPNAPRQFPARSDGKLEADVRP